MASTPSAPSPSPELFWRTINAYQRTEALRAAVELGLFTAVAEGNHDAAAIGRRCSASERGTRILCDFLATAGFLEKSGSEYRLTQDSAVFLDRRSPAYMGDSIKFLNSSLLRESFLRLPEAVRKGGTAEDGHGTMAPEHPIWIEFARAMAPIMRMPAQLIARKLGRATRVLDIAAGHGLFGIEIAKANPEAHVTALDWAPVLEVAKENAAAAGIAGRYSTIAGSAFEADLGSGYDVVLLTNFLHHFDPPTCEALLRRVHNALAPGGRVATLEFIPNEDRISPPDAASFSLIMLATTDSGDAYTFSGLDRMFRNAGFANSELHELPPTPGRLVITQR